MFFNWFKTIILLTALMTLVGGVAYFYNGTAGLISAVIITFFVHGLTYFFSDRIVLRMYNAQPLTQEQYPDVYAMVQELTQIMRIPMPSLFIINRNVANAFATGRNPSHASVAVTQGILSILQPYELRAVLAHELAHIKNRDILVGTIAAMFASIIGYLAYWLRSSVLWGQHKKEKSSNPVIIIVLTILVPFVATLIQLAISRSREYLADESGALCCKDPLALASALEKLHNHVPHAHFDADETHKASTAHLFIVYPFLSNNFLSWFSTHPPMSARIKRLRALYEKQLH
jgi:heat shock protein HtpX